MLQSNLLHTLSMIVVSFLCKDSEFNFKICYNGKDIKNFKG